MMGCLATSKVADRSTDPRHVLTGPLFYTGDAAQPWARAIVVDQMQRVVSLIAQDAPDPALLETVKTVALPGVLATAGLVDAHVHLHWIGQAAETADLRGVIGLDELRARLVATATAFPELPVLRGYGWDESILGTGPSHQALANIDSAHRPIVLTRLDGHAVWLNDVALEALGVADLLDGGGVANTQQVMRDEVGAATGLIIDPALAVWNALADPPDLDRTVGRFERALTAIRATGLASVHDMATRAEHLDALAKAQANLGESAPRVVVYLEDTEASWGWFENHAPGPVVLGPLLEVRGLKLFADGALGSRGAALREPYSDAPGESGSLLQQDILDERVARAVRLGFDVAIHAIGDRAVDASLKAFEAAREVPGPRSSTAYRHRVEHAQIATASDRARFAALGVIASMQPTHGVSDSPWACARIGPERGQDAYAIKSFHDSGVPIALGSDAPIESFDPIVTLRSAIVPAEGPGPCSWLKTQKLSPTDALGGMTHGAAFAAGQEGVWGRIAVGMPLDLTLFDINILSEPERTPEAHVVGRVIGGADGPVVREVGPDPARAP